jgi:outer membrane protein assembly factor BamA
MSFLRQTERAARAMASYPFSRARRIEFHGGVSWLAFDQLSGFDIPNWTAAAPPVTLSSGAVAFVSDTSHSGPLSVVRGERYRLEIAPVLGTIEYVSLVADYRRYAMPFSFYTIAARVMHLGRYGSGAEDPRIAPLYVGYPWLVRGYDRPWTVVNECVSVLSADCPELSGLLGSRLAVANLEFRFPLLRPLGLSSTMYGPLPVEVALFVDGGTAWRASRFPSHDDAVMSTGMTLRTSLLGFGLGQFDIAYPFRQAASGWVMQFNLSPAF